ncbi:REP-associated tyrosine transposase [Plebeiibacterium sediminum]|uniref:Transposase n=1 Tax=Plebeiibacterium sediminum TaxID=2992112 RepID=A0AAE3M3F2_9BACT|nr:transposase [Plebeiobacterium sediminum]MCW3786368.1 transposase [Plebeiobacterium sediminum]
MSTAYQIREQGEIYFVTLQIVNWIDLFSRLDYRNIVIDNLKYCQKEKGLVINAYVIMSNHIHLIIQAKENNLSNVLRDFKSYTSKCLLGRIVNGVESRREWLLMLFKKAAKKHNRNSQYQVFTHENHAVQLYSDKFIDQKLDYIHENPVRAGLVMEPQDYIYSSATNYAEESSVLDVVIVDRSWNTI